MKVTFVASNLVNIKNGHDILELTKKREQSRPGYNNNHELCPINAPHLLNSQDIPSRSCSYNTTSYSRAVGDGQVGQVLTFNLTNFATVNTVNTVSVFNVVSNFDSHFGAKRRIAYFVRQYFHRNS